MPTVLLPARVAGCSLAASITAEDVRGDRDGGEQDHPHGAAAPREVARSDEANTAVLLTSATPIISADALDDVRRGARATFWRARVPGTLNSFSTGQPITRVTGVATVDDKLAIPRNKMSAPMPASAINPAVPPGRAVMRTSYMATHTREHLDRAIEAFSKIGKARGVLGA